MTTWMISANTNTYDHDGAFSKWGFVDWRQLVNFEVGDTVYIYASKQFATIKYKTVVLISNMSSDEIVNDDQFWKTEKTEGSGKYARLKLIKRIDNHNLDLAKLRQHGLNNAPQRGLKLSGDLLSYIEANEDGGENATVNDINTAMKPQLIIQTGEFPQVVCPNCNCTFNKAPRCPECGQKILYSKERWNKPKIQSIDDWVSQSSLIGMNSSIIGEFVKDMARSNDLTYHIGAVDLALDLKTGTTSKKATLIMFFGNGNSRCAFQPKSLYEYLETIEQPREIADRYFEQLKQLLSDEQKNLPYASMNGYYFIDYSDLASKLSVMKDIIDDLCDRLH